MGTGTAFLLLTMAVTAIGGLVALVWNMQSNRIKAIEDDRVIEKARRETRDNRLYDKMDAVTKDVNGKLDAVKGSVDQLAVKMASEYTRRRT